MAKATFYFSHDFSARNDPKLQMVLRKYGMAGIGAFWCLVELLHEQDGYLMLSQCDDYAFALRSECDLIKSLVNDFGLFQQDGEKFWSNSALERIEERKSKSVKAKQSAEKRWSNANALRPQSEGNAIKEIKGNKEKEIKKEKEGLFDSFYEAYDKKLDKQAALKAWMKIDLDLMPDIIEKAKAFVKSLKDRQYQPYPASWLNGRRWEDELTSAPQANGQQYSDEELKNLREIFAK